MRAGQASQRIGPNGVTPGDLYLAVVELPHPVFRRQDDDLHCDVRIPMTGPALSTYATVDALDGTETIEIQPGTQPGRVVPLLGKGTRHLDREGRGDLFAHLHVETATALDPRQEELLRELARLRGER